MLIAVAENDAEAQGLVAALQRGLQEAGWIEDRNIHLEYRWGAYDADRAQTYAAELVSLAPDLILAHGTPALTALRRETRIVPIVFVVVADPVGAGSVAFERLAR